MKLLNKKDRTEIVDTLSLGIVEAGKSKSYEVILQNDSMVRAVDLKVSCENPEITIDEAPSTLLAGEEKSIKFTWSPSITLKEALSTRLNVAGYYLYEAKKQKI